jgi:hypothetical protein
MSWLNLSPCPKTLLWLKKSFAASKDAAPKVGGIRPSNWRVHFCAEARVRRVSIDVVDGVQEENMVRCGTCPPKSQ